MASVKGILVSAMKSFLAQQYGADAVTAATAELPPEEIALIQKRHLDGSMYPYETMIALRHLMRLLATRQTNAARDFGAYLADYVFTGVYKSMLAKEPATMVAKIPWLKDFFYNDLETVEASMIGTSSCRLVYRYEEGVRVTRSGCQGLGSFWARTLELAGAKQVVVTHSICARDGADRCEFVLSW
ncbi:MAG: hypothetical protein ACXVJT_17805 [Thermoanaerobaculia bacterium]